MDIIIVNWINNQPNYVRLVVLLDHTVLKDFRLEYQ